MVFFTDTPGFLVGVEGERQGLAGRIMNFIQALEMSTVPKFAVILRKSYGQAYLNMGGKHDQLAAWYTADIGFMDPNVGVNVVHGVRVEDEPERFARLRDELARNTTGYDLAAGFYAQDVIDPRQTRDYLKHLLEVYRQRPTGGVGAHRLRYWPTSV
jgi:acetyl-CoA carboxylase carboxyltransferase component